MNAISSIITNKYVASSLCLIGGYALNSVTTAVNRFAVEHFGIPIDWQDGKEYNEFVRDQVEANKTSANLCGIGLDRQLGATLLDFTTYAIREEISYRFLLETIVLPCIFPQFAAFSIARTCVSSALFAAAHLNNPSPQEALAGQFLHTAILGVICSLAQDRIGLLGSIFVHIGFNVYGWQRMYNQNFSETVKKIRAVNLLDVVHPVKIAILAFGFIGDALSPFVLTYRLGHKILLKCKGPATV